MEPCTAKIFSQMERIVPAEKFMLILEDGKIIKKRMTFSPLFVDNLTQLHHNVYRN